jgi:hypothetical protein
MHQQAVHSPSRKTKYENNLAIEVLKSDKSKDILKKEDKFVYAQAIMNLYLSVARIYSKLYEKDDSLTVKHLESSFRSYEFLQNFMKDYMKDKGMKDYTELSPGMLEPYRMMLEMIELLPVKISKLVAVINSKK